jgi:drug/metabolite transporter (DMT)-like permease
VTAQSRATTAIVVAALLWGSAGTFIKYALGSWQPVTLLMVQLAGANLVLWTALFLHGYRWPRAHWRRLIVLGTLEPGLCYALITLGLQRTSAANSAVLSGMESFFVVTLAAVFLREPLGRRSLLGLAAAICGVLVLEGTAGARLPGTGDLLVLAGILCAAVYVLVARNIPGHIDTLAMTAHQFAAGLALLLPFGITEWATGGESLPTHQSAGQWATALLIGIAGFACSFLLYNRAIASISASRSSIILNLMPVFGTASAILVLGESFTIRQGIGAALIIGSIFVFPGDSAGEPAAFPQPSEAVARTGTG